MTQDIPPLASALPPAHGPANASALIHNGAGAYLLHLRDDIPGIWEPGAWSLLGGGREPGDRSLEETVRRELQEEASLNIPHLAPFAVEEARASDGTGVPIHIFVGQWSGDPAVLPLTEGVMLHWFRPEIMPRLRMAQSTRDLIRRHAEMFPATLSGAASSTTAADTAPAGRRTPRPTALCPPGAAKPCSTSSAYTSTWKTPTAKCYLGCVTPTPPTQDPHGTSWPATASRNPPLPASFARPRKKPAWSSTHATSTTCTLSISSTRLAHSHACSWSSAPNAGGVTRRSASPTSAPDGAGGTRGHFLIPSCRTPEPPSTASRRVASTQRWDGHDRYSPRRSPAEHEGRLLATSVPVRHRPS